MKRLFLFTVLLAGTLYHAHAQNIVPLSVYRDAFPTLESSLGFIKYTLEKPQMPLPTTSEGRIAVVTVDSVSVRFGSLEEEEEVRIIYRFHARTESKPSTSSPQDSVSAFVQDVILESEFMLLDLLTYNPAIEKGFNGLLGMQLTLDEERTTAGVMEKSALMRDGRQVARERALVNWRSDSVLLICYNEVDRMRLANTFFQAQHLARTRNRLRKMAGRR